MFCDVLKKTNVLQENLFSKLPKQISDLIIKVNDFSPSNENTQDQVIIIKLVERLQNMRTIEYISPQKRTEKSAETLHVFIPLAQKLSIKKIEDELKILSLKYVETGNVSIF